MPTVPDTVPESEAPYKPSSREKLYEISKACIGKEMSPADLAADEVGCVESLEGVYRWLKGRYISGHQTPLLSTYALYTVLLEHPDFTVVHDPLPGDIVVSPTGLGNGKLSNGHCGIVGKVNWMSNQSFGAGKGTWQANFTKTSWYAYYRDKGGFPVRFFRPR